MFEIRGSKMEILMQLVEKFEITTKVANTIFDYLDNHQDILGDDESFESNKANPCEEENSINLLFSESGYYINVRRTTIAILAVVLDCFLTKGMSSAALALAGVELQAIMKLKEEKLCLVKEMIHNRNDLHDCDSLSRFGLECINNDIPCRYNVNGMCTLKKDQLSTVLVYLSQKGIIKPISNKYKATII